jgi:ParB/RepB/Spo0J family partition protein
MDNMNVEVWSCTDQRLPATAFLNRQMPDAGFIHSIEEVGQLNPIIVNHINDSTYHLIAGRARLMAIREIAARGGDGDVYVRIVEDLHENTEAAITMIENAQRSVNPVADYIAARVLLLQGLTYKQIGEQIGTSLSYVKKLDQDFAGMPQWALRAIIDENMTVNTAKALNKLSDKAKEECHQEMLESPKKKLTMTMVQAKHRLIQQDAAAQITSLPGMNDLRRVFTRDEMQQVFDLLNNNPAEALAYVAGLLAETE